LRCSSHGRKPSALTGGIVRPTSVRSLLMPKVPSAYDNLADAAKSAIAKSAQAYRPVTTATLDERNMRATLELAARFDALNQQFAVAEAALKALKPVRSVYVHYNQEYADSGITYFEVLGLEKYQDRWRLVHCFGNDFDEDKPFSTKPLIECPVEIRVRASSQVRKLHAEIVAQKEKYIPAVDAAIQELSDFCNEIK
jgi:hypothetical protein